MGGEQASGAKGLRGGWDRTAHRTLPEGSTGDRAEAAQRGGKTGFEQHGQRAHRWRKGVLWGARFQPLGHQPRPSRREEGGVCGRQTLNAGASQWVGEAGVSSRGARVCMEWDEGGVGQRPGETCGHLGQDSRRQPGAVGGPPGRVSLVLPPVRCQAWPPFWMRRVPSQQAEPPRGQVQGKVFSRSRKNFPLVVSSPSLARCKQRRGKPRVGCLLCEGRGRIQRPPFCPRSPWGAGLSLPAPSGPP